jgi:hypothetical protein
MSENLKDYGISDTRRLKIEEWFDNHPYPWNIDCIEFNPRTGPIKSIKFYCAEEFQDDFLIKIVCDNATYAANLSKETIKLAEIFGLEKILINKSLFLLRRSFFNL